MREMVYKMYQRGRNGESYAKGSFADALNPFRLRFRAPPLLRQPQKWTQSIKTMAPVQLSSVQLATANGSPVSMAEQPNQRGGSKRVKGELYQWPADE